MKLRLTYLAVFLIILSVLAFLPKTGGYIWQPEIINPLSALLFTLLVYLTGHIARSAQSATGILCTAMFVLLFCPARILQPRRNSRHDSLVHLHRPVLHFAIYPYFQ